MPMNQTHKLSIITDIKQYCDNLQVQSAEPNDMFLLKFSITEENNLQAGTSNKLNQKICKIIFITKAKVFKISEKIQGNAT